MRAKTITPAITSSPSNTQHMPIAGRYLNAETCEFLKKVHNMKNMFEEKNRYFSEKNYFTHTNNISKSNYIL